MPQPVPDASNVGRFWSKVKKTPTCWLWTAGKFSDGYGGFHVTAEGWHKNVKAHRFAYETEVGPIPAGLVLDHLCQNKGCVNPAHLEPVTNLENLRRADALNFVGDFQRSKTHCVNGHAFSEENTRLRNRPGRRERVCIACEHASNEKKRVERIAKAA